MNDRRWTISVLTIPQRESYVAQLVESLHAARVTRGAVLSVVYNWDSREAPDVIEARLRRLCRGVSLDVTFNMTGPTIVSGRQQQLNACKTPLLCFVDDDLTVHGDLLGVLDEALVRQPLGIVGIPSYVNDSDERFKPRDSTPHVLHEGLRFSPVQGMLVAGYRRLFLDVGGFNARRQFWGEWTELNLRMWRSGFPTAYAMEGAWLRHWHDAPESPTRNRTGRESDILWGLMCTALEYDAADITAETGSFWRLVSERYLAYAFGAALAPDRLLSEFLRLVPRLASEWPQIAAYRDRMRLQPFGFAPFAQLTRADVEQVLEHARPRVEEYRTPAQSARRTWREVLRGPWVARQTA